MRTYLHAALGGTILAGVGLLGGCNSPEGSNASSMAMLASNTSAPLPGLPASLPLQGGAATAPVYAPAVARLPDAPRPALRELANPDAYYAYLDRAASYDDAIGDAPPDYAFGYDGVTPWGWQADDGSIEYAEPIDDGYRYYYYAPGADTPYLVRDPHYSYAFDAAALVAVYDLAGRVVPRGSYGPRWDYAGRFFARARALRTAAQANRQSVVAANWAARRAQFSASNAAWDAARARDSAWAAYHARAAIQERAHWQGERAARTQATARFADFQQRGFQGPPPGTGPRVHAGAPQRVAAPPAAAAAGGQPRAQAVQAQAMTATREANHLAATQHLQGTAPHGAPGGQYRGGEPRVNFHQPEIRRGQPVQPRAAAEHGPAEGRAEQRGAAMHHEQVGGARTGGPAGRAVGEPRGGGGMPHAASHMEAPRAEAPHMTAPHMAAPRMEAPHMEASHMQAPHMEAPHAAPAPHAAAAPHGPPGGGGGGGHEHH